TSPGLRPARRRPTRHRRVDPEARGKAPPGTTRPGRRERRRCRHRRQATLSTNLRSTRARQPRFPRRYSDKPGPVAQWIERQTSNLRAMVRLHPGPFDPRSLCTILRLSWTGLSPRWESRRPPASSTGGRLGPGARWAWELVWNPGDRIPIPSGRTLQLVRRYHDDTDGQPVLVVEDLKSV